MQFKQSLIKSVLMSTMVIGLTGAGAALAQDRTLNIYNWSDYIDESVLKDFEKDKGIKVNYDVFDSNEMLETKMLAGSSGYDVVVPSANFLSRQIEAGAFTKLDKSKLPNLKNVWEAVAERTATYDEDNAHAINYMWGTTGIGYNVDKIKEVLGDDAPVDSWDILFKPENMEKLAACGVHVLDAPSEMIPAGMKYLGKDVMDNSKANLKAVEALFASVRPHIKKFHSSEYIGALANGDICLAVGFSGDVFQAQSRAEEAKNGVNIEYSIPKEGAQMWFDQMAIPVDAKNVEAAYEFINYVLEPEVAAKITNYVAYANGNKAAQAFVDKEILENPAIYPTDEVMETLYTMRSLDAKVQRLVNRSWTKIKSGE